MIRVVIDTNIMVSALKSRRGASYYLISNLPSSRFLPVLSVPLYFEYQDVLTRSAMISNYTEVEVIKFLRYICGICHLQEIFYLWRPCLKDPKDDMVLELAVASGSRYVITHNLKDFRESEAFGVKAIGPKEFMKSIGGKK